MNLQLAKFFKNDDLRRGMMSKGARKRKKAYLALTLRQLVYSNIKMPLHTQVLLIIPIAKQHQLKKSFFLMGTS